MNSGPASNTGAQCRRRRDRRLRKSGSWMEHLVGQLLFAGVTSCAEGRRLRLLDRTTVPKAGKDAKKNNRLWRFHCSLDLAAERFSFVELTDEKGGERLDRTPNCQRRYRHRRALK